MAWNTRQLTLVILVTGANAGEITLDVAGVGSESGCGSSDGTGGKISSSSEGDWARSDEGTIVSVGDGTWFYLGKPDPMMMEQVLRVARSTPLKVMEIALMKVRTGEMVTKFALI